MVGKFEDPKRPGCEFEVAEMPAVTGPPGEFATQSGIALAKERSEQRLMAINGVEGVAIGRDRIGDDALVVYLRDPSVRAQLPSEVEGYSVETVVTGSIDAL